MIDPFTSDEMRDRAKALDELSSSTRELKPSGVVTVMRAERALRSAADQLDGVTRERDDYLDTLAAVYAKLGLNPANTRGTALVSDTVLALVNDLRAKLDVANNTVARMTTERDQDVERMAEATKIIDRLQAAEAERRDPSNNDSIDRDR